MAFQYVLTTTTLQVCCNMHATLAESQHQRWPLDILKGCPEVLGLLRCCCWGHAGYCRTSAQRIKVWHGMTFGFGLSSVFFVRCLYAQLCCKFLQIKTRDHQEGVHTFPGIFHNTVFGGHAGVCRTPMRRCQHRAPASSCCTVWWRSCLAQDDLRV